MTIEEILTWADRMKSLCESTDEEIASVQEALKLFFTNKGCTGEGVRRENWIESNRVFAEADRERERRGACRRRLPATGPQENCGWRRLGDRGRPSACRADGDHR